MKTYKNLYEQICSFENLYNAFCKAKKGKLSRYYCAKFSYFRESEILCLRDELLSGAYKHGNYRCFDIYDPKFRRIKAASFRDRVVHHALCNVIEPIFEKTFIYDSFACRKGKGTLLALERCKKLANRFCDGYVLKADISKYFYTIDHKILLNILRRKIKDERTINLCAEIISSSEDNCFREYFPGDDLFAILRPTGIPIGNLTSQLFSNIYLNELDKFVKQTLRYKGYLRYMDDFLLFSVKKSDLWDALCKIKFFLASELRLNLHSKKQVVFPVRRGIDWVGYIIYPDRVKIRRENIFRFRNRNNKLRKLLRQHKISMKTIGQSIASFCAYALHADSKRLIHSLLWMEKF